MSEAPQTTLNNGLDMPVLGFGVFQVAPDDVEAPVRVAIESGYRLIDTASGYGNEQGVGRAMRDSGVPREQLFITTKLTNSDHGYDRALRAFDTSLEKLSLDYVDLYLIHWPVPAKDLYVETWRAFEKIYKEGRARSIGVSNFTVALLSRLIDETATVPAVNQVELHPKFAAGTAAGVPSPPRDRHRGVGAHRSGQGAPGRPKSHKLGPAVWQVASPGCFTMAPPNREHRHPQVDHPRPDPLQHRHLRLRAEPRAR